MASPFAVFRKNQKALLVVLAIFAMFAFVVADQLPYFFGNSRPANPRVVTSKYGRLNEGDLYRLLEQHKLANRFMGAALEAAYPGQQVPPKLFGPNGEEDVVDLMLWSQQAKEQGITVSDEAVLGFIRQMTQDRVTGEQLQEIVRRIGTTKAAVYDALRMERAAQQMAGAAVAGLSLTTPAQRWEYYERLHRKVKAEIVAVPVADFAAQVPDPDEATLRDFFDKHKDTVAVAGSPDPGFKVPAKAVVEYFTAEYEKFFDPSTVTPEQIAEHYEKFKQQQYRFSGVPKEETPKQSGEIVPGTDEPAKDETKPAEGATPSSPEGQPPAAPEKSPETPAADTPAAPETPGPEAVAPEGAAPTPPAEAPPAQPEGQANASPLSGPCVAKLGGRLLAVAARGVTSRFAPWVDGVLKSLPAVIQESPTASEPAKTPESQPATPPADTQAAPATETPSTPAASDAAEKSAPSTSAGTKAADSLAVTAPIPEFSDEFVNTLNYERDIMMGENPEYDPLWKVEGEIREQLGKQQSLERMQQALEKARESVSTYATDYSVWLAHEGPGSNVAPPTPPDWAKIAEEHKLQFARTPSASQRELADVPGIGSSRVPERSPVTFFRMVPFADYVMSNPRTFVTSESEDDATNLYLFWKSEFADARVPELAEAKPELLRVWKMIQGRTKTLEKADALAAQAREKNLPLAQVFAASGAATVAETNYFSWLTLGTSGGLGMTPTPSMSEVPGVSEPGNAFMRTATRLGVGDVGVAFNNPETVAYVVRVTAIDPSIEILRAQFASASFRQYESVREPEMNDLVESWRTKVRELAEVDWDREPIADESPTR